MYVLLYNLLDMNESALQCPEYNAESDTNALDIEFELTKALTISYLKLQVKFFLSDSSLNALIDITNKSYSESLVSEINLFSKVHDINSGLVFNNQHKKCHYFYVSILSTLQNLLLSNETIFKYCCNDVQFNYIS